MIEFIGLDQGLVTGAIQSQTFTVLGLDTEDIDIVLSNPMSIEALSFLGEHFTSLVTRYYSTRTEISCNMGSEISVFRHPGICMTNNSRVFPKRVSFGPDVTNNSTYIAPWLLCKLAFGQAQYASMYGVSLNTPDSFIRYDIPERHIDVISYGVSSIGQTLYVDIIEADDSITTVTLGSLAPGSDRTLAIGRAIKGVIFRATGPSNVNQVRFSATVNSHYFEKPFKSVMAALMFKEPSTKHGLEASEFDNQEMLHLLASECQRAPRLASPLGHGIPRFLGIKASYEV